MTEKNTTITPEKGDIMTEKNTTITPEQEKQLSTDALSFCSELSSVSLSTAILNQAELEAEAPGGVDAIKRSSKRLFSDIFYALIREAMQIQTESGTQWAQAIRTFEGKTEWSDLETAQRAAIICFFIPKMGEAFKEKRFTKKSAAELTRIYKSFRPYYEKLDEAEAKQATAGKPVDKPLIYPQRAIDPIFHHLRDTGFFETREIMEAAETVFYSMPDSTTTHLIYQGLNAGANMADLKDRMELVDKKKALVPQHSGDQSRLVYTANDSNIIIDFDDIRKLTGKNTPAKKFFVLTLIKANEQAIFNGVLKQDYVSFPLQELVDLGFYQSTDSARRGFNQAMETLTSIKARGRIKRKGKKKDEILTGAGDAGEVLFTGWDRIIGKGQCIVYLNHRINWDFIAQYFTLLPAYYFGLPSRPSDLLYYISFLARQNTKKIAETGSFNISFRAIQMFLRLPNENKAPNPYRDIKEAIENAITEIETAHRKALNNKDLQLEPVYNERANIVDYLDNGYLKVYLNGKFAEPYQKMYRETMKKIDQAEKRKQKRIEAKIKKSAAGQ